MVLLFHADRLGDGAEGVKINFAFSFEREGKGPDSLVEMRENKFENGRLAKSKIEFLRVENRFLAGFLSVP